jgi:hypothetical protein
MIPLRMGSSPRYRRARDSSSSKARKWLDAFQAGKPFLNWLTEQHQFGAIAPMPLQFGWNGDCLEATFSGTITAAEISELWEKLATDAQCGLVIFDSVSELPTSAEIQQDSARAALGPVQRLAFVGGGAASYGFAHVLSSLCGLRGGSTVYTKKEEALRWLQSLSGQSLS